MCRTCLIFQSWIRTPPLVVITHTACCYALTDAGNYTNSRMLLKSFEMSSKEESQIRESTRTAENKRVEERRKG